MSGGFPLGVELTNGILYGQVLSTTGQGGTTVSPSATANTKGSFVQITPTGGTTQDADVIEVTILMTGGSAAQAAAVDIAIGPSGSQIVVFNNLMACQQGQFARGGSKYLLPCSIPKGTAIWARSQAGVASSTDVRVTAKCFQSGFLGPGGAFGVDSLSFTPSATTGTAVTAGNGAYGAYAQMAVTTRDYSGVIGIIDTTSANDSVFVYDIGIGIGGSQIAIVPGISQATQYLLGQASSLYSIQIPAGSTLWARASDSASGSGHPCNCTLYGVYG